MSDPAYLLGLDCAAQPQRFGVAVASLVGSSEEDELCWHSAWQGLQGQDIACAAVESLREAGWSGSEPLVIGMDAPLGWPVRLGAALSQHRAGQALAFSSDELFRRETDDYVYEVLGRRPLEVGADRIARAAVTALAVLDRLRLITGLELPVAVDPSGGGNTSAVLEVYPASYLLANDLPSRMYKRREQVIVRDKILAHHGFRTLPQSVRDVCRHAPDVLDAALCVLISRAWVKGTTLAPRGRDRNVIAVEGWVWIPEPG